MGEEKIYNFKGESYNFSDLVIIVKNKKRKLVTKSGGDYIKFVGGKEYEMLTVNGVKTYFIDEKEDK